MKFLDLKDKDNGDALHGTKLTFNRTIIINYRLYYTKYNSIGCLNAINRKKNINFRWIMYP